LASEWEEHECSNNNNNNNNNNRNLGMKNIEAREPPSMAEVETYWKSLWGEEAQHNERTEWIKREEKRKISHMDWRPIQTGNYFIFVKSSQLEISWK
jgi:hypothetical protein